MRIALVVISLLLTHSVYSQVHKFRIFQSSAREPNKVIPDKEIKWNEVDLLLVVNLDRQKIQVYSSVEQEYDIIKKDSEDLNEEKTFFTTYSVVDKDGNKCELKLVVFDKSTDKHIGTLAVKYTNVELVYRFKKT